MWKQVDVLPSKNQAQCDLIYNVLLLMVSQVSEDSSLRNTATHTNLIFLFKSPLYPSTFVI